MKTNYYALLLLSLGSVLLWAQCDTPIFENIDHPFEVGLNDTVTIPITVVRGAFPMLNDSLLKPELEKVIKLYQEDIVPLISSREGANYLWIGIQLPENWSTTNNFDYVAYDSLPAMNIDSGTFVYSQEHIDLLNTEWSYPLDSGNKWVAWKSADPVEFDYGKMWTNPQIITDDNSGYFRLSYLLGYDNNAPCDQIINNLTIASAMMDTAWVTNTNDAGDGSLRRASLDVRSNGLVLFSLDTEDTIYLSSTIPVYKSMQINNDLSENLVNIKGPGSGNIFNIDHSIFLQYYEYYHSNISIYNLNLFGAGNEAIYATYNRYFNLYNSSIHHNEGSGLILNGSLNNENQFYYNIDNCEFYYNTGQNGGGVRLIGCYGSIDNTKLYNNSAFRGGGMYIDNCQNTSLDNCAIYNNNADFVGGGIRIANSSIYIGNSEIHNNISENGGGSYIGYESSVNLENTCIKTNNASQKGGGCYIEDNSNSNLTFLTYSSRCNIYLNQSPEGNDLYSFIPLSVVVDTFTVMNPTNFHAAPIENFTFDILHASLEQVPDDLYVSPDGDNHNSGLTTEEPLKNFYYAFAKTMADTNNQQTIHLMDGTYSPSANGELFPLILPDFVNLVGISDSSTILDAEGMAGVLMINNNSSNLISGITITGGNTSGNGGGIYCYGSNPIIEDVTISGNQVTGYGGGIYCLESDPLIQDVTITGNQATGYGGGLYCEYSEPILLNIYLAGNSALNGGGMTIYNAYPTKINNLKITGNSAYQSGGGIFFDYTGNLDIKNTTISNNTAKTGGGICFGNRVSGHFFSDTNRCNIYFNQAESGNELFTGWESIYIRLDTFSVMHPGDYYATPFHQYNFDIWNAKLKQVEADLYVSPNGDNSNSGLSADKPLKNLRNAITLIRADYDHQHTVYLMDGTYSPSTNYDIFPLSLPSCLNLSGTSSESVILDAEGLSGVFTIANTFKNRISDMTITGGSALNGGGIYIYKSSPVLQNLVLKDNNAENYGGALYCERNVPSILNTSALNNNATYGGGISLKWSNASITNVKIQGNTAENGGALYCDASQPQIINSLITKNTSNSNGGAIYLGGYSNPDLINVTIANNFAGKYGGGIHCEYHNNILLYNTIMWNDLPQEVFFSSDGSYDEISIFYSNIQGGEEGIWTSENGTVYWEEGSIDQDPEFIEFSNDDNEYTLTPFSPCIDAGRPDTTGLYLPEYDLADNYRLWDGDDDGEVIIDMGAFEFASHPVGVPPVSEHTVCKFQCFPNPVTNSSQIAFELDDSELVQIEVFNLLGEKIDVIHQSVLPEGKHIISWNTGNLANGFYMVQLQAGNSTTTQKLLKQ